MRNTLEKQFGFSTVIILCFSLAALGAPEYEGPGCDEQGNHCIFGTRSNRVEKWFKVGTTQELGKRCEKFIENIESRKNTIAANIPFVLNYHDFRAHWTNRIQADGQALINCSVDLHSETKDIKFETRIIKSFNWVCENENSSGICLHYLAECTDLAKASLIQNEVLDSRVQFGSSLLQGYICQVVTTIPSLTP
jgi:hypothetical protein